MRILLSVLASLTLFLFGSCNNVKNTTTSGSAIKVDGTQWIIHYFVENGQQVYPEVKEVNFTIDTTQRISGKAGCNRFNGQLTLSPKGSWKSGAMAATKMACQHMDLEMKTFKVLEQTNQYKVKGAELFLYQDDKLLAVFESFR